MAYVPQADVVVTLENTSQSLSQSQAVRIYANWRILPDSDAVLRPSSSSSSSHATTAGPASSSGAIAPPAAAAAAVSPSLLPAAALGQSPPRSGHGLDDDDAARAAARLALASPDVAVPDNHPLPAGLVTYTLPASEEHPPVAIAVCSELPHLAVASAKAISVWNVDPSIGEPTLMASVELPDGSSSNPPVAVALRAGVLAFATASELFVYRLWFERTAPRGPGATSGSAVPLRPRRSQFGQPLAAFGTDVDMLSSSALIGTDAAATFRFDGTSGKPSSHADMLLVPGLPAERASGKPVSASAAHRAAHPSAAAVCELTASAPSTPFTDTSWGIHSLQVLPEHAGGSVELVAANDDPLSEFQAPISQSAARSACRVLVAGERTGMLLAVGASGESVTKLCDYAFTSPASAVLASDSLVYVATATGMETWSLRGLDGGFGASYPPPAVLGMQVFMGVRSFALAGDALVVLSKMYEDETAYPPTACRGMTRLPAEAWNIYILHSAPLGSLVNDISARAAMANEPDPGTYFLLLLEAYLLLQTRLAKLAHEAREAIGLLGAPEVDLAESVTHTLEAANCTALLHKTAALLAAFQMNAAAPASAAHFLWQSDIPLTRGLALLARAPGEAKIYYLDRMLFAPVLLPRVDANADAAAAIVALYARHAPTSLARLALYSCLQDYPQEPVLTGLAELETRSPYDTLAYALLALDVGKLSASVEALLATPPELLTKFVSASPGMLYVPPDQGRWTGSSDYDDDYDAGGGPGSDPALPAALPSFAEVLAALDSATLPFSVALDLLESACGSRRVAAKPNSLVPLATLDPDAALDGPAQAALLAHMAASSGLARLPLVECFLERAIVCPNLETDVSELAVRLSHMYLARILDAEAVDGGGPQLVSLPAVASLPASHAARAEAWLSMLADAAPFGEPYPWLALMPAPEPIRPYVAKLSSLLASPLFHSAELLLDQIQAAMPSQTSPPLHLCSLELACLAALGRTETLVKTLATVAAAAPVVPLAVARLHFGSDAEAWRALLDALNASSGPAGDSADPPVATRYVLEHMARILPPATFMQLLPSDGDLRVYFPLLAASITGERSRKVLASMPL
ncbi:uncharacterized protein AMSG_05010 [Thecamonas trahens ATCC 50062]|uniref:BLOC-2 complex member HPS3 C-terminal domain-containing protein n=1 Tax=Thecamonas trahens ATCC 50062 TaxID=461836 RepID=A0A0L0D9X5_THETB|nr:hypothetical protein AMSG_05010 [Thecamonas trahens ATCC 50062]KNC49050.1 hypothetical protein AMSG_05010 [Thecamonas trahens ATCC 50062]|eukprot:XP_013758085.1 hypothetical protein AMSG_05010 [Thecamonas trahens ATCC 50062]